MSFLFVKLYCLENRVEFFEEIPQKENFTQNFLNIFSRGEIICKNLAEIAENHEGFSFEFHS